MDTSDKIATLALLVSVGSAFWSYQSYRDNHQTNEQREGMRVSIQHGDGLLHFRTPPPPDVVMNRNTTTISSVWIDAKTLGRPVVIDLGTVPGCKAEGIGAPGGDGTRRYIAETVHFHDPSGHSWKRSFGGPLEEDHGSMPQSVDAGQGGFNFSRLPACSD